MTTMARTVFHGCSAWVGRIDSESRCRFWTTNPLENNFDPILLVPVDLSKSTSAAQQGKIDWDEVQVDDYYGAPKNPNGPTTIGPSFPDGATTGFVFLAESYLTKLRSEIRPTVPPPGSAAQKHEFMTAVYQTGARAGRRYAGTHVKVHATQGSTAEVEFLLHCPTPKLNGRHKLDLASLDVDEHIAKGGLTEIDIRKNASGGFMRDQGSLFVDFKMGVASGIVSFKVPLACGTSLPFRRETAIAAQPVRRLPRSNGQTG